MGKITKKETEFLLTAVDFIEDFYIKGMVAAKILSRVSAINTPTKQKKPLTRRP